VITTTAIADDKLFRFRAQRIVAVMNLLAKAAGVRRGWDCRQRQRGKVSREGEEEQQSGGQAMHEFYLAKSELNSQPSIEQG
jgi:hypothetical protein